MAQRTPPHDAAADHDARQPLLQGPGISYRQAVTGNRQQNRLLGRVVVGDPARHVVHDRSGSSHAADTGVDR